MTHYLHGMYGVGDCLHQRAIVRALLDAGQEVVLDTFYYSMYEDLVERGLRLRMLGGVPPRIRDRKQGLLALNKEPTRGILRRISYGRDTIKRHGSILAAQFAAAGLRMPKQPDFSLSVPGKWREDAIDRLPVSNKPIMVYRPSVLNDVWLSEARAPDPKVYREIYEFVRDSYLTVSVANLGNKGERIDGPFPGADVQFNRGELDFEELTGLFSVADAALTCPGFSPVLAQAVGTRTVIVYGGNESFATTNSVGAHLAPTLAIEPIRPCACHLKTHDCDKTTDVAAAMFQVYDFLRLEELACAS